MGSFGPQTYRGLLSSFLSRGCAFPPLPDLPVACPRAGGRVLSGIGNWERVTATVRARCHPDAPAPCWTISQLPLGLPALTLRVPWRQCPCQASPHSQQGGCGEEVRTFEEDALVVRRRWSCFREFGLILQLNSGCLHGACELWAKERGCRQEPDSWPRGPKCHVSPWSHKYQPARPVSSGVWEETTVFWTREPSRKALANKGTGGEDVCA